MPCHVKHVEILMMNQYAAVKSSLQNHAPRLSDKKISSTGENRNMRSQRKDQSLNSGTTTEQAAQDQCSLASGKIGLGSSVRAMPSANRHKPWPSRKVNEVNKVVRNIASIPNYLTQLETQDNVQDKELKFRVLDWGHLDKSTYLRKQVANGKSGDSPSSSNASSSLFSTVGSSSQSDRSINGPLTPINNSINSNAHQDFSARGKWTKMNEQRFVQVANFDSRAPDIAASAEHSCEKGKVNGSDLKSLLCNKHGAFKDNDEKMEAQIGRSIKEDNFDNCEKPRFVDNKHLGVNGLGGQFSRDESALDHLEQSAHERRNCYDYTRENRRFIVDRSSFSGGFTHNDIQLINLAPGSSSSCQISSTSQSDEPSDFRCSLSKNEMLTSNAKAKYGNHRLVFDKMSENKTVKVSPAAIKDLSSRHLLHAGLNRTTSSSFTENSYNNSSASSRKGRRSSSPQRLLTAGLNMLRNSSLRDASPKKKMERTVGSDNSQEGDAAINNRSRQSPLRRIFDPLKRKNQVQFSGLVTSSPSHRDLGASNRDDLLKRDQLKAANVPGNSSEMIICPLSSQVTDAGCLLQTERQVAPTRQALLKLAWKNGLPVFVFSSSDINILSARMRKNTASQSNDFECNYTIFTAHELKKKGGVWTSQINKSKKHELAYNVVGQMKVSSCISESKTNCSVREFVLFNVEQASLAQELASQCKAEVAAIVVHVPNDRAENCNCRNEKPNLASIVAILPGGVHGISDAGKPSPLIERWRSGGSCDCGGWDEGCMLTVLTNKAEECKSSNSVQTCSRNGGHRIELFTQVGGKGNKHAFSMIAFQEGVYTVDFGTSISTVQAFAMCIAILHNRKPLTLSGLRYSTDFRNSNG